MTLETTVSKAVYTGNGATTEFPFSFKVWEKDQILVSVTDAQGYVQETGEYSVALSAGGGTVSYLHEGAPLPSGWKLAITRDMPFTQEDDYITGTRFDPEVIETALDKATAERQQLLEQLQRAVILPPTSDETPEDMAQELLRARDEAVQSAGAARNSQQAAADSASDAAASEQAAAESVRQAEDWTERAQAWAESPTPPDPDDPESKSAKEWAKIASDTVPIATPALAGKVKPQTGDEDGLELGEDGSLRVRKATTTQRGSVLASTTAAANAVPQAEEDGIINKSWIPVMLPNSRLVITESNAAWTPPATGWARVTVIGGGGAGTSWLAGSGVQLAWGDPGGDTTFGTITAQGGATSRALPNSATISGRYRVGGGCAGEVKTEYIYLDKSSPVKITIGAGGIAGAGTSTSGYTGNPGTDTTNDSVGSSAQQAWGGNGGRTGYGYGGGGGACGLTWGAELTPCNPHSPGYGHDGGKNAVDAASNPLMGGNGGQGAVIIEYYDPEKEDA